MATTKPTKPAFKIGQKIRVKKTGAIGKLIDFKQASNGLWLITDFGDKKQSMLRNVRPSAVEKV
jgi:hypothetical protein